MNLPNRQVPYEFNQMHYGASFWGILGTTLVLPNAPIYRSPCI